MGKVLDDRFGQILQTLELDLEGFEFGDVAKAVVGLSLHAMLHGEEDLLANAAPVGGDPSHGRKCGDI